MLISQIYTALSEAIGFMEIPDNQEIVERGEEIKVNLF